MNSRFANYKIFLVSSSVLGFAFGLFAPFWIVFIQQFGDGIQQFGFSIGLMVLAQSLTSYFSGKFSDKLGRKIFLIIGGVFLALIVFAYTLIESLLQLYVLQVLNGVATAILMTMETTFLGDVTKRKSRGLNVGKYHAIVGIMSAIAMMGGGFVVGEFGFKVIFYIVSGIIFISALVILKIKE